MKFVITIPLLIVCCTLSAQVPVDAWMDGQLGDIKWQGFYKGVLADFHPVTIQLASDHNQVAGYLVHEGDQRKHKLLGDWSNNEQFQLQERDDYERLTGYLTGSVTADQVQMNWISSDQSRMFSVRAFPERLIRIQNFKPIAEWITIASTPAVTLSVQKMDFGIVSGVASRDGYYTRFEGYCLDGSCSIWNTVIQNPAGVPIKVQMRQKSETTYKATLNGTDYMAQISNVVPLKVRQFDNSMGFLDFVYPEFKSENFNAWLKSRVDKTWDEGMKYLSSINQQENPGRLVHRSSGWIEVLDEGELYVSGMITLINPGIIRREPFLWIKKEDLLISQEEYINAPEDIQRASTLGLAVAPVVPEPEYQDWLKSVGYDYLLPVSDGLLMVTEFNMIYGDDLKVIAVDDGKSIVRKKYWKYVGW